MYFLKVAGTSQFRLLQNVEHAIQRGSRLLSEKCFLFLFTGKNSQAYKIFPKKKKYSAFILRDVSRGQKGTSWSCHIRSDKTKSKNIVAFSCW